jgi:Rrf2 family nitric oxide-sensitive transcriptional repressor
MARAYSISRSHLTKIVNELAQNGFIETTRRRSGAHASRGDPARFPWASLGRMAEKDFAIVQCHAAPVEVNCAILPACNLRYGLRRAADAFLYELTK